jgi:multidrug efflux pump subunit AcrA (membrane-fusion protein)
MTTQTHNSNGTSAATTRGAEGGGTTSVLDQARATVAATQAVIDQAKAAGTKARADRDAAEGRRKGHAQSERDEHARHKTALTEIQDAKRLAVAERDAAQQAAVAADTTLTNAVGVLKRNLAVIGVMEADRAPRNRSVS